MNTQSDRPDGDRLLPCPLCKSASQASTAFDGLVYEGHVVICTSGKCGCQSGVFPTPAMARKAWNTRTNQPARDAAEGALAAVAKIALWRDTYPDGPDIILDQELQRHFTVDHVRVARGAAPPKPAPDAPGHTDLLVSPESIDAFMEKNPLPAPDAMRFALLSPSVIAQAYRDWAWMKKGEAVGNMLAHEAARCAFTAGAEWASSSAPVPPGDGANGLYFEPSGDGMGACIHHANGAIICEAKYDDFGDDPSEPERIMKQLVGADCSNAVSSDDLRSKIYEVLQKEVTANRNGFVHYGKAVIEIAALCFRTLTPPCAGAADPVGKVVDQILHQFENDERTLYPDYEVIIAIEKIQSAVARSSATPPVRGEAIARIID